MRENSIPQMPLAPVWGDHDRSRELEQISSVLDELPELNELAASEGTKKGTGSRFVKKGDRLPFRIGPSAIG